MTGDRKKTTEQLHAEIDEAMRIQRLNAIASYRNGLRIQFAAAALTGLLANPSRDAGYGDDATSAFNAADAMLAEMDVREESAK